MRSPLSVAVAFAMASAAASAATSSSATAAAAPAAPMPWPASMLTALAWPLVAFAAFLIFRRPLTDLLSSIGGRATKVSVFQVAVELGSPPPESAMSRIEELTTDFGLTSSQRDTIRALLEQVAGSSEMQFLAIDLGSQDKRRWLTSRLFLFCSILEPMRRIRCVVFVERTPDYQMKFIGCASPRAVRWRLAMRYPWLEQAYAAAYCEATTTAGFNVVSDRGELTPDAASEIVNRFVHLIQRQPQITDDAKEWTTLDPTRQEHGKHIQPKTLRRFMKASLWADTVSSSPDLAPDELARQVVRRRAPFVARVTVDRIFTSLIDRVEVLEQIAARDADKYPATPTS